MTCITIQVGGQAVLGRQQWAPTPWLTERRGYDRGVEGNDKRFSVRFSLQALK